MNSLGSFLYPSPTTFYAQFEGKHNQTILVILRLKWATCTMLDPKIANLLEMNFMKFIEDAFTTKKEQFVVESKMVSN